MYRTLALATLASALASLPLAAQDGPLGSGAVPGLDPLAKSPAALSAPLTQPTLSSGVLLLLELEGRFAKSVAAGGGKAFASWFADDAVTLNNGRAAVMGHNAIAAQAVWDAKTYQLTWVPEGAQMGPSNDMGFTWGRYEGRSRDRGEQPVVLSGRYFTVWRKLPNGDWKVALDGSANAPPVTADCCSVPKP